MFGASNLTNSTFYSDHAGKELHTAETTPLYHFLAYCICAATFASAFFQITTRLKLHRVTKFYGTSIATKYVGRIPHLGAGGISFSLMAMQAAKTFEIEHKKLKIPEEELRREQAIQGICGSLLALNAGVALNYLFDRSQIIGINSTVRLGGTIFGVLYAICGNAIWERSKQIFYEREERLQNAIAGKPIRKEVQLSSTEDIKRARPEAESEAAAEEPIRLV
ncbi:uncharacterized protein FA14DRAFT_192780 [Meira miltonrushii]|uniref:Uncharacterized protein n=1 Tax=Meira miltonrushii TaxID=1280837 RepID=A0A316V2C3_9BASI|nr:uncharacterized protein FA14DRAFT_192780 [Meira miltonrushii]PWN31707.1 hypothetical protein FA14DRAFT_192780 [Meira miltonrushii]